MDIMVQGTGRRYYKPDECTISLNFITKAKTYETALEDGAKDVQIFIETVLEGMKFTKEDLKTRSFRIYEKKRYDYEKKAEIREGFEYNQDATLKFDYDINVVAEFMDKVSKLNNPPQYTIAFGVKNEQQSKNEALADAYNEARTKAEAIANAAGKLLGDCLKIDFRPFEESVSSGSMLRNGMLGDEIVPYTLRNAQVSAEDTITNIFTPEDIEISETLYCMWIAR